MPDRLLAEFSGLQAPPPSKGREHPSSPLAIRPDAGAGGGSVVGMATRVGGVVGFAVAGFVPRVGEGTVTDSDVTRHDMTHSDDRTKMPRATDRF